MHFVTYFSYFIATFFMFCPPKNHLLRTFGSAHHYDSAPKRFISFPQDRVFLYFTAVITLSSRIYLNLFNKMFTIP